MELANICDKKLKNAEEALTKIVKEDNQLENFEINAESTCIIKVFLF